VEGFAPGGRAREAEEIVGCSDFSGCTAGAMGDPEQ